VRRRLFSERSHLGVNAVGFARWCWRRRKHAGGHNTLDDLCARTMASIVAAGYVLTRGPGVSGVEIDLAVSDPDRQCELGMRELRRVIGDTSGRFASSC
jgi:hypothetical protein